MTHSSYPPASPTSSPPGGRHHSSYGPPYPQESDPAQQQPGYGPTYETPTYGTPPSGYPAHGQPPPGYRPPEQPSYAAPAAYPAAAPQPQYQRPPAQQEPERPRLPQRADRAHVWAPEDDDGPDPFATPDVPEWQRPYIPFPPPELNDNTLTWADLALQVHDRMRKFNSRHASIAFEHLGTPQAIAPNALALFYAVRSKDTRFGLATVHRTWYDGPDTNDFPQLLAELTEVVRDNIVHARETGIPWDPRGPERSLVNGGQMDMPRDAVYIGAGVSSLNTPNAEWNLVAPQAQLGIDVPGRSIMLLTNGHAMRIERRRVTNFGDTGVYSNKTLDPQRRSQQWWNNDPYREEDASLRGTWYRLHDLHELIASYLREAS